MPAPVVLFVYNRPAHARVAIEALSRNTLAPQTDLIIFSDGPKDAAAGPAVLEVRTLIADLDGFASVRLIHRERHLGLARSIISGVSEVMAESGAVIVLEDDLATTPMFLAYMNAALEHYRRDPRAFSIGAYQFPAGTMAIPREYPWDTYAGYRCCSWGWATWQDRWDRVDWTLGYVDALLASPAQQARFNRGGQDMTNLLASQRDRRIDSWAIQFCHAHVTADAHCIYPVKSLVNNIGLDHSGTHSSPDSRRQHTTLDEDWVPRRFCPAGHVDPVIASRFRAAFRLNARGRISAALRSFLSRPARNVDVLVVNTFQKRGGAARAAYRTFLGITRVYPRSHYLTLVREDRRADISGRDRGSLKGRLTSRLAVLDRMPLWKYPRRPPGPFTPALRANPLRVPLSRFNPKLVHLHWVSSSMLRIEELAQLKVPVVWTLHDAWPFTGGCHFPGACTGFRQRCGHCPQLGSSAENDLSRAVWQRKVEALSGVNLTVVSPSRWLANLARQSSLCEGRRVEVIPNGLDTNDLSPTDKTVAKTALGVDGARPVLLFGAQFLTDPRKGADLLFKALAHIDFPCTLLTFGEGELPRSGMTHVTVRPLGPLKDDASLSLAYSAADMFVCPSREDNLPNTVAEALACGTPSIAFDTNGLPDMIEHQQTGWLARPFDPADLAAGIRWVAGHAHPEELRTAARQKALAEYSLPVMTERYAQLYAELLTGT